MPSFSLQRGHPKVGIQVTETWDFLYEGFLKWEYPKMDGLKMENPTEMDDLGVPILGNLHIK
jgi:hypothetical protein